MYCNRTETVGWIFVWLLQESKKKKNFAICSREYYFWLSKFYFRTVASKIDLRFYVETQKFYRTQEENYSAKCQNLVLRQNLFDSENFNSNTIFFIHYPRNCTSMDKIIKRRETLQISKTYHGFQIKLKLFGQYCRTSLKSSQYSNAAFYSCDWSYLSF